MPREGGTTPSTRSGTRPPNCCRAPDIGATLATSRTKGQGDEPGEPPPHGDRPCPPDVHVPHAPPRVLLSVERWHAAARRPTVCPARARPPPPHKRAEAAHVSAPGVSHLQGH